MRRPGRGPTPRPAGPRHRLRRALLLILLACPGLRAAPPGSGSGPPAPGSLDQFQGSEGANGDPLASAQHSAVQEAGLGLQLGAAGGSDRSGQGKPGAGGLGGALPSCSLSGLCLPSGGSGRKRW